MGQFLGTRPDIVGIDLAKELQKLQDTLPPYDLYIAKDAIKMELGEENFKKIKKIK